MKILITGANGMLGSAVCPILLNAGYKIKATDIDTTQEKIDYLDVRDFESLRKTMKRFRPDFVIHLAAETDVDRCETESEHAFLTNALGTENVALVAREVDCVMVYISTAAVFDGEKETPYNEFDRTSPLSVYGRTKLEGELAIQRILKRYFIIRTSWLIGGFQKDKKFVGKIIRLLKTGKEISAVTDKIGSPTFTEDFSRGIIQLIKTSRFGLYHLANKGIASRYEIAKEIVRILGRKDVIVKPVTSEAFSLAAPRGRSEGVENFKLRLLGWDNMRTWQEALEEYVKRFK